VKSAVHRTIDDPHHELFPIFHFAHPDPLLERGVVRYFSASDLHEISFLCWFELFSIYDIFRYFFICCLVSILS
jgi:hypothetical protein